jgi:dUTP pyrophosphatase
MTSFASFAPLTKYILRIVLLDSNMRDLYVTHVNNHNAKVLNDPFPDSGFDLFVPSTVAFQNTIIPQMVGLGVKCEMVKIIENQVVGSSPFYMYPRSSMSKTPLMLANQVGIIDSGYRGELIAALRNLGDPYQLMQETRLTQICLPSLEAFTVQIVDEDSLSSTERGAGGFGSTGIIG